VRRTCQENVNILCEGKWKVQTELLTGFRGRGAPEEGRDEVETKGELGSEGEMDGRVTPIFQTDHCHCHCPQQLLQMRVKKFARQLGICSYLSKMKVI